LSKQPPDVSSEPELFDTTAGRFTSAAAALALLSSVAGSRLAEEAVVRRGPRGEWWVELAIPLETASPLVWTAGGEPFGFVQGIWIPAAGAGDGTIVKGARESVNASNWNSVGLAELIAATNLQPAYYRVAPELNVIVPGSLGRWVLRRATMLGLSVTLAAARRTPLVGKGRGRGALLFRVRSERGTIPASLVRSLCSLPYAVVAYPSAMEPDNLMIDVRHRSPFPFGMLASMIPGEEIWVLGPPDVGHWRLDVFGEAIDGGLLLEPPATEVLDVAPADPASLPEPLPVRLVKQPGHHPVDAVLLDDDELQWLRHFLIGRPLGESAFLILGDGIHFLISPGGLPGNIPFGTPVARAGKEGLYVEMGRAFQPPLPDGAQRQAFGLNSSSVVAVTDRGAFRFSIERLVPAWSLWVGETPVVEEGMSEVGRRVLGILSEEVRNLERDRGVGMFAGLRPRGRREKAPADVPTLLQEATRAEMAGDFLHAAELLERAGQPARAGRLYERAARRIR